MDKTTVKCFRTLTGEEVLAEVIEDDGTSITIKNPIAMVMTPSRELAGIPWLPLSSSPQNFTITKAHLTIIYTPNDDVIANYRQQTGGIITAPASVLNQLETQRRGNVMLPHEF